MNTKSKTKKAFVSQKQSEPSSLSSLMRRFKSHDVYASLKPSKPKNQKQSAKQTDGTTITINLNLPHTNLNIDNWSQNSKNPKRVISEKQRDNLVKSKTTTSNWKKPKEAHQSNSASASASGNNNNYALNTGRIHNQIYTMKILNEESIQELDTEENYNTYDDNNKKEIVNNEGYLTSYSTSKKQLDNIMPYSANVNVIKSHPNVNANANVNPNANYFELYDNSNRQLILAAKKGDKDRVLELIDEIMNKKSGPRLDFKDENGWNAMHYACDEGNLKIVEILLKTNIDINSKTNDKKTPLHLASRHGYFDISKQLIENDALISAMDNEKNTPIHLCTIGNHLELLKFLCDKSKGVEIRNIYGKKPIDLAANEETKTLLKQYIIPSVNPNVNATATAKASGQTLKVKIHTTNSKHVNTLIKQITCKEYKTPIKYTGVSNINANTNTNYPNESNGSSNNPPSITGKVMYSTTTPKFPISQTTANTIRPMTSKQKFSNSNTPNATHNTNTNTNTNTNNIQNNNININISTNLCNVSNQNQSQQKTPTPTPASITNKDELSSNQKSQVLNNAKVDKKKKMIKNQDNKKLHQKSTSEKVDKSSHSQKKKKHERYSIVTQLFNSGSGNSNSNTNNSNNFNCNLNSNSNNNKTTSQSLNKRNTAYTPSYQTAASLPHSDKTKANDENISQSTKRLNSKNHSKSQKKDYMSDQGKEQIKGKSKDKDINKDKGKEKAFSNKNVLEKSVKVTNVEISLEQQSPSPKKKVKEPEPIEKVDIREIKEQQLQQPQQKQQQQQIDKEINTSIINLSMEDDDNIANEDNEEVIPYNEDNEEEEEITHNDNDNDNDNEDNDNANDDDDKSTDEEKIGPSSFICLALLGRGSFGEVYLVQKKNSDSRYAMKVLDKDKIMGQNIVKYAMTERNVLSLTSHPFIVKLNFAFQTNEKLFLLLDYCPGGDLAEQLTAETRFAEDRAKLYICEIILALGDLHQKNIIFRDLKPDNVVLDSEGHAMLTDFGLSREGVFDAKIAKSFCGSIAYLAPEMLSRKGHGKAVDWYLLGVLFYEMLVGVPPYFTNNKDQIFKNIQYGELQIPRFVNPKAAKILRLLLKKNPNERLGSVNDVEEIKENEYFQDVDWDKVYNRELKPPIPKSLSHAILTYKHPKMFTENNEQMESVSNVEQKFEGWSFVQNNSGNGNNTMNNNNIINNNTNTDLRNMK